MDLFTEKKAKLNGKTFHELLKIWTHRIDGRF